MPHNSAQKILYIAGAVTGIKNLNREAFECAAKQLQAAGYDTCIPHSFVPQHATHSEAMRACLARLLQCDGVAMLPSFRNSKGALFERDTAHMCGIPVRMVAVWLEMEGGVW